MKVLFFTPNFTERRGGVEKRFCLVANELTERGAEVRVLTARERNNPRPKFPLHHSVSVHFAKVEKESVRPLLEEFRPDIVITVNGQKTSSLLSQLADLDAHVIMTEQLSPDDMSRMVGSRELRLENLAHADAIHMLLPSYAKSLPPALAGRCRVIPNQCELPAERADCIGPAPNQGQRRRIVYVARLDRRQKRQQVLVQAFAKLRKRFPEWELWLWGDHHDLRTSLYFRFLLRRLGVAGRVFLPGPTDDVTSQLLKSQLLVFPSAYEGFPSALLQGMACGLPCIGFDGCAGVNELIVHRGTGLLVPGSGDPDALAEAMELLMSNPGLRDAYGLAGREAAGSFSYERFREGWLELVEGVYRERMSGATPVSRSRPSVDRRL
jgi:glycosyltransferase involved in cell wall biosynthesis